MQQQEMLYLEDLQPDMSVNVGPITVSEQEAIEFARQFDPQPFHTDPVAARDSFFQGLAVSGWHVAALSMRMLATSNIAKIANGLIGLEIIRLRWPRPTRPGDSLLLTVTILSTRASASRPGWGTATTRWVLRNQRDETAMELENVIWVQCRPQQ